MPPTHEPLPIRTASWALLATVAIGCGPDPPRRVSKLYEVGGCDNPSRRADVVFVHGLDGHHKSTWHPEGKPGLYWPAWVAEDNPDLAVWSLDYPAASFAGGDGTMHLMERGPNVLGLLREKGFAESPDRPLVFVVHSLGGLLVKQLLERAEDADEASWVAIGRRTRGVAFIATPHSGSNLADFHKYVSSILTETVRELRSSDPNLLRLNRWYNKTARERPISSQVFYEKRKTPTPVGPLQVVSEASATGIAAGEPLPIDRDHLTICKPASRDDLVYSRTNGFIRECLRPPPPCRMPLVDPAGLMGRCGPPSRADATAPPAVEVARVVLTCKNLTGEPVDVALYDWYRHYLDYPDASRWHYVSLAADDLGKRSPDWEPESRTFDDGAAAHNAGHHSVYVRAGGCRVSACLLTTNLYGGLKPTLTIRRSGEGFTADFELED